MRIIPKLIYDGDGDDWDIEDEKDEHDYYEEIFEPCSCPYCQCANEIEYGVICDECLAGSHQG